MLNIDRLWRAALAYLPVALTIATLAPIAGAAHLGIGGVVLACAICLTARHRGDGAPRGAASLLRVPAIVIGTATLGLVFSWSRLAGDVLFVAVVLVSRLAGRYGPRAAAVGRALLLPLLALFLAPPVPVGRHPVETLGWVLFACLVAGGWLVVVPLLLPQPPPDPAGVVRAARRVLAAVAAGRPTARRVRALTAAAGALDARLPAGDEAARPAVYAVQHAVDRLLAGVGGEADVGAALARLTGAVRDARSRSAEAPPAPAVDPADAPSPSVYTRLALQSAAALTLAFLVGQWLFPEHWPWTVLTVLTVLTVSLGARSRGEVVVKGTERLAGAIVATSVVTPLATATAGHPAVAVGAILLLLPAGLYLREISYVYWAGAMTALLALLYGLLGQTGGLSLLGERLLAIALGGLCAVLPAAVIRPIRSRDLVRKRVGGCLRRLRECLEAAQAPGGPGVAAVRRADAAIADMRRAARPLLLTRRLRSTQEAGWADTLDGCGPALRALLFEPDAGAAADLRRVLIEVAGEVRRRSAERGGPPARGRTAAAAAAADPSYSS